MAWNLIRSYEHLCTRNKFRPEIIFTDSNLVINFILFGGSDGDDEHTYKKLSSFSVLFKTTPMRLGRSGQVPRHFGGHVFPSEENSTPISQ